MTTSLAFCANNGISLLVDPVNQPTADPCVPRSSIYLRSGATDPDIGCLVDSLARDSGFIRGGGPNPTFVAT
jgi:hypothetical protein